MVRLINAEHAMRLSLLLMALAWLCPQSVRAQAQQNLVYTCVDKNGRTLTSDRPIVECIDREQRILQGSTGHEKGVLPRSYTEAERIELRRQEVERLEQLRLQRDKQQRERLLRMRYPDRDAHDRARVNAKTQVESVIHGASANLQALQETRAALQAELEFYQGDTSKAPPALRRKIAENQKDIDDQEKILQAQQGEKGRIDAIYDAELEILEKLWAGQRTAP